MFNPSRMVIARHRRRMSSRGLAEAVGLTPVHLSRLENGHHEPEEDTVTAIAKVLGFPVSFFHGDEIDPVTKEAVSFRSMTAMKAAERDAAIAAGHIAYLLADWTTARYNLPGPDFIDASQERDPARAARWLRQHWGLGEQPIKHMIKLLEAKGVRVFSLAESTKTLDAFSCWRGDTPYVFLNTAKSSERSRFDAAHELGHLVLHKHGGPQQGKSAEYEAQLFAASFLMPQSDIEAKIPRALTLDQIVIAKRRWGVSAAALAYRLNKLGILSDWLYRGMVIEMGRRQYRDNEPNEMEREESVVWQKVLSDLWSKKVTKDTIAADLHVPIDEIENLIFGLVIRKGVNPEQRKAGVRPLGLRLV
ncbi:XRE family transcriptional regulator [Methylobacterium sp. E-065]|uniref:helix-turn-helix domain-containing protein n=1 Tax=Methylobacterium sp. E-065 TaxID=2836583 RepID=UPI001FBB8019|nr:XRE family transcriptional regulator [Methylobacterium sp. E-065]MCJ2019504.1 XRE family transcriptional regulator [Methylobacterium sp. E-065]